MIFPISRERARVYIDTVEIFSRKHPPCEVLQAIRAAQGRPIWLKPCFDRNRCQIGFRLFINRPEPAALALLDECLQTYSRSHRSCLRRVDIALDILAESHDEARRLAECMPHHLVVKWRRPRPAGKMGSTYYWGFKNSQKNACCYVDDKPRRKAWPPQHYAHFELRFMCATYARRSGLRALSATEDELAEFINRHVYAFDPEPVIGDYVRRTVADDRRSFQRRRLRRNIRLIDNYRARIPARVRALFLKLGAQGIKDILPQTVTSNRRRPVIIIHPPYTD